MIVPESHGGSMGDEATAAFKHGVQLFRGRDAGPAVEAFGAALARPGALDSERRLMLHSMRGDCHAILGRPADALADFGAAVRLAPENGV